MATSISSPSHVLSCLDATAALSILRARDSIFDNSTPSPNKRHSDVSTTSDGYEDATPASLQADLAHYKASHLSIRTGRHLLPSAGGMRRHAKREQQDLFSKLRFSYIEQVTKEKFLRAIASTPPLLIDPADNAELEQQLAELQVGEARAGAEASGSAETGRCDSS